MGLGDIYQTKFHPDPLRIIAFDDFEVFYDGYWSTLDSWTFSDGILNKKCFYYRAPPYIFLHDSELLREQPLTEKEFAVFRPDLPLRLCRSNHVQWLANQFSDIDTYLESLMKAGFELSQEIVLDSPEVFLYAYKPKKGVPKSVRITAKNGIGFTNIELLWNAQILQAAHLKEDSSNGVGLFRLGHEKKMPSYYIGNYFDEANFLKD
jgi:hypothetical protein